MARIEALYIASTQDDPQQCPEGAQLRRRCSTKNMSTFETAEHLQALTPVNAARGSISGSVPFSDIKACPPYVAE
jgi:hypothetical protein